MSPTHLNFENISSQFLYSVKVEVHKQFQQIIKTIWDSLQIKGSKKD